ncbi:Divalent metal cation transporter MntH [Cellulomonas sp. T2.31MG-18]|uniref:NRAMP family divalent metal transporter n=1 Tax=Cellulomonas sp. T2.31MG-18 TaxID=3157619 RepID=UPI0035E93EC8
MVMLADTDAGSVITAAQSGALYGYQLVASQVVLIPVLYLVQEMTARLGLVTGRGHGDLIRATFGSRWALLSAVTLFAACVGALVTEFAGLAGVGSLVGLPRAVSIAVPTLALVALVLAGGYRRVERVGIAIGALELLFIPAAVLAHPRAAAVVGGLAHPVQLDAGFLGLLAANVGAVIMPWMVFYQQEAVIDKDRRALDARTGSPRAHLGNALRKARVDTALGAVLTQAVMIAVVVAVAATIGAAHPGTSLNSIGAIADALGPFLGGTTAATLFGLGMLGAATVAALVVSLAGAWGLSEVLGWRHSLNDSPRRATGFYALAVAATLTGALVALLAPDLVNLSVDVEVMNAGLLPIVLGFLLLLERRALPREHRMHGPRRAVTLILTGLVISLGLYTVIQLLTGHL